MSSILFHSEISEYQFTNHNILQNWLKFVAATEKKKILILEYFFVGSKKILELNKLHLGHNYLTDIITFNYSFLNSVSGEIFVCIPVVKNNAILYSENNFEKELNRVILHGLLHLVGYNDKSISEQKVMRKKENIYLNFMSQF